MEKYAFCVPPEKYKSWEEAELKEQLSLEYFQHLFRGFYRNIRSETNISVLLAFDESQALFENGITVSIIIRWTFS